MQTLRRDTRRNGEGPGLPGLPAALRFDHRAYPPARGPASSGGGQSAGTVGFWDKTWQGETVYETGWSVLPQFQGLGVATSATKAVVAIARAELKHRFIHAFPSVANAASNAICRKVGFTLRGEYDFEYPPGNRMRCNDWSLDLTETAPKSSELQRLERDSGIG